jgi:phytoene synthase
MSGAMTRDTSPLDAAYRECERFARSHYENFPVALLLPGEMRRHVAAVYVFARVADDFADEPGREATERLRLLDAWLDNVRAAGEDRRLPHPDLPTGGAPDVPAIFTALRATIGARRLPLGLFEDLLSAFRQDVLVARYDTWDAVLDYCRRSANPVGRLVLRIAGLDDEGLHRSSDALCTALQLTNFWQDLAIDFARGRIYLPADVRERFGAGEADLRGGRMTPAWQRAMGEAAEVTSRLFRAGEAVCDGVRGRLGFELRLTWLGGTTILQRLQANGFDVFAARPTLARRDAPSLAWRALAWRFGARPLALQEP